MQIIDAMACQILQMEAIIHLPVVLQLCRLVDAFTTFQVVSMIGISAVGGQI